MYATINLPGSSHFDWYGPADKKTCQEWLDRRTKALLERGEMVTSLLPQQIISNRNAAKWRYLDGSQVLGRKDRQ